MAKFKSEKFGVSFTLPDKLTVGDQLRFRQRVIYTSEGDDDNLIRLWSAALPLIEDWQCDLIDDPEQVDLEADTRPEVADIVHYTANSTAAHIATLKAIPKNS